jgi:hypothetical protein
MSAAPAETHGDWTEWEGQPPAHYEFPDKAGTPQEWDGWLLGSDSTETDESTRWTEIEVYRTITGKYVIRVLGKSVIYHRHYPEESGEVGCNTGDQQLGRDMDADMRPCRRCRPPADYTRSIYDDLTFNVEVDIPTITTASNARQLLRSLRKRGHDDEPDSLSYLSGKLLRKLSARDPAIADERNKRVSLN